MPPSAPPARPTRRRKLHAGHFAFMRALVQGLDLRASWERYLKVEGQGSDLRQVRATIAWIRDEFAAAARREDRHGLARLVLIDTRTLLAPDDPSATLPTLEQFALSRGLQDFAQTEQLAAYEAEFGRQAQRLRRRARLIERQLDALRWLESLVAQAPQAGDAVAAWLHPDLADRLEAAGLFTLAQLVERINGIGRRWVTGIPGIGPVKGERILAWLREHEPSHGLVIGSHVAVPRQRLQPHELEAVLPPATAIRPLEKLIVPAELDGRHGLYRRPPEQCLLQARNDHEAVWAWLRSKQGPRPVDLARRRPSDGAPPGLPQLSHTQRAYRKEAERFLLWAIVQKGKPLSSMNHEDCIEYRNFLADPQPRSRWCGPRSRERWSTLWRPFEGPLSPAAQRQALTVLRNLYGYLVDQNYLMGNPWSGVSVPLSGAPKLNAARSLSPAQWTWVVGQLDQLPDTSAHRRLRVALKLLYATGLRLSEVVAARLDDLQWVEYPPDAEDQSVVSGWLLRVLGKGQRLREVPVPDEVVAELSAYLAARGLVPDPRAPGQGGAGLLGRATDLDERAPNLRHHRHPRSHDVPLPQADPQQGIAASTLYGQIKAFFRDCAQVLAAQGDTRGAERFARASTHWLRHSHASHTIARGLPIEIAQQNLGHASLATTTVYVTTESKRRMKALQRLARSAGG